MWFERDEGEEICCRKYRVRPHSKLPGTTVARKSVRPPQHNRWEGGSLKQDISRRLLQFFKLVLPIIHLPPLILRKHCPYESLRIDDFASIKGKVLWGRGKTVNYGQCEIGGYVNFLMRAPHSLSCCVESRQQQIDSFI